MHKITFFILILISFSLNFNSNSFSKEKPKSGVIEGKVIDSSNFFPPNYIGIESNELIPKTTARVRYFFEIPKNISPAQIKNEGTKKIGTPLRIHYVDLTLSEMDYFYTGKATKIEKIPSSQK